MSEFTPPIFEKVFYFLLRRELLKGNKPLIHAEAVKDCSGVQGVKDLGAGLEKPDIRFEAALSRRMYHPCRGDRESSQSSARAKA